MNDNAHYIEDDDNCEYIDVEIEEEPSQEEEESSGDVTGTNKNDLFYIVRHGKLEFLRKRMDQQPVLKVNTQNNTRITPLMSATISRRHGIMKFFLTRPEINVNMMDDHKMSALLYAAANGDQRCLSYLLNAHAKVDHINTELRNMLHILILRKHVYTTLYVLDYPDPDIQSSILATINHADYLGMTPLLYACELGRLDLVKFLIYKGADPTATDGQGIDAFCHALRSKDIPLVRYFITELEADVNKPYIYRPPVLTDTTNSSDPIDIHSISSHGGKSSHNLSSSPEAIEYIKTPLFYAVDVDSPHLIQLLLQHGASHDYTDTQGETPFLYACRFGKLNAMYTLLYRGANPNDANKEGTTALLHLIKHDLRDELKYVYCLQQGYIKPHLPEKLMDLTTLEEIVSPRLSDEKLYKILHDIRDDMNRGALIHTVFSDNGDALRFLIDKCKCDISLRDRDGKTALYHAVERRYVKLFELLIDVGADVNTRDEDDNTVLMHAADSNNIQFLSSLLFKQAEVDVLNKHGWSVLTFSCKTGNETLFSILLKHILSIRSTSKRTTDRLLSIEHLSLCLNVACVYARPTARQPRYESNHVDIIRTLLQVQREERHILRGCPQANPNIHNPGLELPIIAAVRYSGNNPVIVNQLLESSSIVNTLVKDANGDIPALIAVKSGFDLVMRQIFIYEHRLHRNSPSTIAVCSQNMSIIHHACVRHYFKCFQEAVKRCPVAHLLNSQNDFNLRAVEFMVLGPRFREIVPLMRSITYPFTDPQGKLTPASLAARNDAILVELDHIYLNVLEERKQQPERSEMELFKEYNNFTRSIKLSEDFIRATNQCRPIRDKPGNYRPFFTHLYTCVIATRDLPTFRFVLETRVNTGDGQQRAPEEPALRTDYVDDHDNTLAEVLFAMAGYEGSSVEGSNFLFNTIRYVKQRPHLWHETHLFKPPQGFPVRGRSIEELSVAYNIPYALELMKKRVPPKKRR